MEHTSIIQTIMPCTYFLVFLLGLLPLSSALTTTERYSGGPTTLDDRALAGRFCLRGPHSKFINHPPQSTEKYIEKTPFTDAAAQSSIDAAPHDTVEPEKISEDDKEGDPMSGKVAARNSKESRFEDKGSDYVKMSEKKTEEANKHKPPPAAAAAPPRLKRSDFYDFEDIN